MKFNRVFHLNKNFIHFCKMSTILFVYLINDYCQRVFLRLSMTRITGDRCISAFSTFKLYRTFKVFFQLIVFKKNFVINIYLLSTMSLWKHCV